MPVDSKIASQPDTYQLGTFTHVYQQGYGSPEVDQTNPRVSRAIVSKDGMHVHLEVEGRVKGHVHEFDLRGMRSREGEPLLHIHAFYTLNEIPEPNANATSNSR